MAPLRTPNSATSTTNVTTAWLSKCYVPMVWSLTHSAAKGSLVTITSTSIAETDWTCVSFSNKEFQKVVKNGFNRKLHSFIVLLPPSAFYNVKNSNDVLFLYVQNPLRVPTTCAPVWTVSTPIPTPQCATSSMPVSRAWPRNTLAHLDSGSMNTRAFATGLERLTGNSVPLVSDVISFSLSSVFHDIFTLENHASESGFTCPAASPVDAFGVTDPHPKYADPADCAKFYICLNGITPREQGCELGLVFNTVTKQCDSPANVPEWLVDY